MSSERSLDAALRAAAQRSQVPADDVGLDSVLKHVLSVVKHSGTLPRGRDHEAMMDVPAFEAQMTDFGERLLGMIVQLASASLPDASLEMHDIADCASARSFEPVADASDSMLEHAAIALDSKRTEGVEAIAADEGRRGGSDRSGAAAAAADAVPKPQDVYKWSRAPDRSPGRFAPRLTSKPHASVPLEQSLVRREDGGFANPYAAEIQAFQPPAWMMAPRDPVGYSPVEETPLVRVESEEALAAMCADLNEERAVAVDLEHHSYRSYLGLLCLMQVSTPRADYVVDVFAVWDAMEMCNSWTANPAVVKVMHGADHDVRWLQRDCGLYLVGLFDTGRAARHLALPSFSLAYLLKSVCRVDADKKQQRADWRLRPLPDDMVRYAREDTHYLLHIFDVLCLRLLGSSGKRENVREVVDASKQVALTTFEKPATGPRSHQQLMRRLSLSLQPVQRRVFAALNRWRDVLARELDESTGFVMPNAVLAVLAQKQPASVDMLRRTVNPLPLPLRDREQEVVALIVSAKRAESGQSDAEPYQPASLDDRPRCVDEEVEEEEEEEEEGEDEDEDEGEGEGEEGEDKGARKMARKRQGAERFLLESGAPVRRAFDAAGWRAQQRPAMVLESDEEEGDGDGGGSGSGERWARVGRRPPVTDASVLALWDENGAHGATSTRAWGAEPLAGASGHPREAPHTVAARGSAVAPETRDAAAKTAFPSVHAVARAVTAETGGGGRSGGRSSDPDRASRILPPPLSAAAAAARCDEVLGTISLLGAYADAFARAEGEAPAAEAEAEAKADGSGSAAQEAGASQGEVGDKESPLDTLGVPRSMSDIFRISNAHRTKGKPAPPPAAPSTGTGSDTRASDGDGRTKGAAIMRGLGYSLDEPGVGSGNGGGGSSNSSAAQPAGWVQRPAFVYSSSLAQAAGAVAPSDDAAGAASAYTAAGRGRRGSRGRGRGRGSSGSSRGRSRGRGRQ